MWMWKSEGLHVLTFVIYAINVCWNEYLCFNSKSTANSTSTSKHDRLPSLILCVIFNFVSFRPTTWSVVIAALFLERRDSNGSKETTFMWKAMIPVFQQDTTNYKPKCILEFITASEKHKKKAVLFWWVIFIQTVVTLRIERKDFFKLTMVTVGNQNFGHFHWKHNISYRSAFGIPLSWIFFVSWLLSGVTVSG